MAKGDKTKSSKRNSNILRTEELQEKIQKKAYELYESKGYAHGNDWTD